MYCENLERGSPLPTSERIALSPRRRKQACALRGREKEAREITRVKKKILVVDDDMDILEQITAVLTGAGYEVASAQGRPEAEELLLKIKPDLAVLDLMMEEKDSGFVLSHQIKKLYPDMPIILLTAVKGTTGLSFDSQNPDAQSWIKVDKILDKPVRPEQLRAEVRRLLQETPSGESGRHS
jgi:CheY-like chemotaxis protein